jgi:hypothetical protein
MSTRRQQDRDQEQRPAYETLTEHQRLGVLKHLFGENRAGRDLRGLHIWKDGGYRRAPTTREALIAWLPEKNANEIDAVIAAPPASEEDDDWDQEDEMAEAAWIESATAQAERIEWPHPASLPRPEPEQTEEAAEQPDKTKTRASKISGFVQIPYLFIDRLMGAMPGAAFSVYCALLRFEGYHSGQMWPGQNRLAQLTGLSRRRVVDAIEMLRVAELIRSKRRWSPGGGWTSNVYERMPIIDKDVKTIVKKLAAYQQEERTKRHLREKKRAKQKDEALEQRTP